MEEEAKPSRRKLLFGVAVACIIIVICFALIYQLYLNPAAGSLGGQQEVPWLFEGAYGEYSGARTAGNITLDFSMRIEVLETSTTEAKLLLHMELSCAEFPGINDEFEETVWVDLTDESYEVEGSTLVSTHEAEVYFAGFGERRCIIYRYTNDIVLMYVDKETGWILKVVFENGFLLMHLTLKETNIPELK